jgi:hypothetical protein
LGRGRGGKSGWGEGEDGRVVGAKGEDRRVVGVRERREGWGVKGEYGRGGKSEGEGRMQDGRKGRGAEGKS